MKLYFLGTCHGAQEKGRFLTCTALEVNGKMYLIDAGAPFVYLLKNSTTNLLYPHYLWQNS